MIDNTPGLRAFACVLTVLLGAAKAPTQSNFAATAPVGTNLSAVSYYSAEWVFVNAFNQAAPWWSQQTNGYSWSTTVPLDVDSNGWVKSLQTNQAAGTLIYRDLDGHYPAGRYLVLYDGDGDLQIGFDAVTVKQQPGRIEIDVTPTDSGIYIKLVRTNPTDYLRNIRVVQPRYENHSSSFHPRFLANSRLYGVLRFMDMQRTNGSQVVNWSDRTLPANYTQDAPGGVALEHMIDMCNELGVDPWFCIPHQATDDYVRKFATMVRDRLDPRLQVWVEYSNEVWNGIFAQNAYAQQQGLALGLSTSPSMARLRFVAERTVQVNEIFKQVLGGTGRLVRVLGSQSANPWIGEQMMDWKSTSQKVDVLAVAPYFGGEFGDPQKTSQVLGWSTEQLLINCYNDIKVVLADARQNAINAQSRGLRLVAYEGGQHLAGFNGAENNQALTNLFTATNQHPYMFYLTRYYLDGWRAIGGEMFAYYCSTATVSKWGSWGSLEYQDQDPLTAPKFWGLFEYAWRNPKWW